jgi:hypothetical protein
MAKPATDAIVQGVDISLSLGRFMIAARPRRRGARR